MIKKLLKWLFKPCKVEERINAHKHNMGRMNPENINRIF